jgi:hypothetical protein
LMVAASGVTRVAIVDVVKATAEIAKEIDSHARAGVYVRGEMFHPRRAESSSRISSQLPRSSALKRRCGRGSLLMRI